MGTAVSGGAIVTGSASGIGREIATTLAKDGFGIVIADLNEAMGAEVVNHIKAEGGQAIFHKVDVTKPVGWVAPQGHGILARHGYQGYDGEEYCLDDAL